jgi:hypothetical protein
MVEADKTQKNYLDVINIQRSVLQVIRQNCAFVSPYLYQDLSVVQPMHDPQMDKTGDLSNKG